MDDDGDDDDDCGYLPKRQDRREREREALMPDLVFVQTGVRSWTTEKDANNTLLRGGVFFFNSAQAPGDIMRRELEFFCYIFRECTLTTYLPTYLMQSETMETTRNISQPPTDFFLFFSVYTKDKK